MEDQLKQELERVLELDVLGSIVRREDLGTELSFAGGEAAVMRVIRIVERLVPLDFADVPEQDVAALNTAVTEFLKVCDEVAVFEISKNSNPQNARDQLQNRLNQQANRFHKLGFDIAAGVAALDAARTVSYALESAEERLETIKETEAAAVRALEALRSTTAKGGVSVEAVTFSVRATDHETQARRWLVAMICFAVAAVVLALASAAMIDTDGTTSELVASAGVRFVLLSLLLYGLGYSGRNFSAARHNQILNEHRADSLNVFETFVEGSSSSEVRDAVLLEATRSIFGAQPSGFLKGGAAESQSPSTIFEVVRRVTSTDT